MSGKDKKENDDLSDAPAIDGPGSFDRGASPAALNRANARHWVKNSENLNLAYMQHAEKSQTAQVPAPADKGAEFAAFCRKHAACHQELDAAYSAKIDEDIISEAIAALARAAGADQAYMKDSPRYRSRATLAKQATALAEAARELRTASQSFDAAARHFKDLHHFLRYSKTLSTGTVWSELATAEGRKFDTAVIGPLQSIKDAAKQIVEHAAALKAIEDAAYSAMLILSLKHGQCNEARRALGYELACLWHELTGKVPGHSGKASIGAPHTIFGEFVKRASELHPYGNDSIKTGFSSFVRDAVHDFKSKSFVRDSVRGLKHKKG